MGFYLNIFFTSETISTRNKLKLEVLASGFLVCKKCSVPFGFVFLMWVTSKID